MSAIELHGLTKRYGDVLAVDDLTLELDAGTVTGFLGPNGAGKTTTLRMLLGLVRPSAGTATFGGRRYVDLAEPARTVGAVLEASSFHPGRRAIDHLRILASAAGLPPGRAADALAQVGMSEHARRRVGGFSLGMRQRLGLAAALLGEPAVLLLDEPANGLDPAGIRETRKLLRRLGDDGRTVFVSSHYLNEVEHLCDAVAIVSGGRCIASGTVHEILRARRPSRVLVRVPDLVAGREALAGVGVAATLVAGGNGNGDTDALLVDVEPGSAAWVNRALVESGQWLTELRPVEASLEDVFLALTTEAATA